MALGADDIKQLSRLFDACESVDAGLREPWFAAVPAEHQHLVPALRGMLSRAAAGVETWELPELKLDPAVDEALDPAFEPAGSRGELIGPYRLLRQLGKGGMGSVWLAERADGSFDRRVAVKLPRLQTMPRGLAERMARESHIAARLEHPHIARLYDAGVDDAHRPYIAFEYVAGEQFDTWCAQPGRGIETVLRTFVQVIRAVAYAHRQLVVHRDLKPANILVDAKGHAFLLDFGIAKLLDAVAAPEVNVTVEYGPAMTRRYASPEQVAGQIVGTASDIYSLGVTLYEALTRQSPYAVDREATHALESAILQGDMVPASRRAQEPRLQSALRGDLDAILWKALQCKPEQRYLSADAMADDIERHLANLPVSVRYLPWFERGRRFVRRHRSGVLMTAMATVVLGVAVGALVHQTRLTSAATERAQLVTEFTAGLFRLQALPSNPAREPTGTNLSAFEPVAHLIDTRFAGRPDVQAELYGGIANVYIDMGVGRLGAAAAERYKDVLEQTRRAPEQVAKAYLLLAAANKLLGRHANAEQDARHAVALLTDARSDAGMEARAVLAGLLLPNGRADEARQIFTAVEQALPVQHRPPSAALAKFLDAQGVLLEIDNHFEQALVTWNRAVAAALLAEGSESRTAARIRLRMAAEELARNRPVDARRNFDLAISALKHSGDSGQIQAALATSYFAALAFSNGLMPAAEAHELVDGARSTAAAWAASLPPQVLAVIDVRRGAIALRQQNLQAASDLLETAVPVAREATDGLIDRRWLAGYLGLLAMARGDHGRAHGLLRQRLQLRVQSGDGATPFAAFDWVYLSHNLLMKGDAGAAEQVLADAPVFKPLSGDSQASGMAYAHAVTEQRARIALARGLPAQALAAMPPPYGLQAAEDRSEPTLAPHALRGEVLCAARQFATGLPVLLASIESIEPVMHPSAPGLARLRAVAGWCALQLGERVQAADLAGKARAAFSGQPQVSAWYSLPLVALERELAGGLRSGRANRRHPAS